MPTHALTRAGTHRRPVDLLLSALEQVQAVRSEILSLVSGEALLQDWTTTLAQFATLPGAYSLGQEVRILANAGSALRRIIPDLQRLAHLLVEREPLTF